MNNRKTPAAVFATGFRPFFLGATLQAIVGMLLWMASYGGQLASSLQGIAAATWHGHEMIFGYGCAVACGFLLTASANWTGIRTSHGINLAVMFLLWCCARLLPLAGISLAVSAAFDIAFMLHFAIALAIPLLQARSRNNYGLIVKVLLLLVSNLAFYAGVFGLLGNGIYLGLYSGLYMLLALIFTIGRRVMPFFIERASVSAVQLKNWRWLDISSLVAFTLFWLCELLRPFSVWAATLAGMLFILHSIRLLGWYTHEIWQKPLLWILYLAYAGVTLGFALKAATIPLGLNPYLALHAFAVAGVGAMTLGMMARITLGHTGRDIYHPPKALGPIFALLLLALLSRVAMPLLLPTLYVSWIFISQTLWTAAFAVFAAIYIPMLIAPRIDGRTG